MYLHIGNTRVLLDREIIGIFGLSLRANSINKQFLEFAPISRHCQADDFKSNKSFIVTDKGVFLSPVAPSALARRKSYAVKSP